jgi:hypothetical protein
VQPMPSIEHNGLVDMFRENPPLAPHLLEMLFHLDVPRHASVGVVESALDQLIPVEFRADLVLELRDEKGKVVLSIILENQLNEDQDKKFAWAVYLAVERSRKRCPALVLVVATDTKVATWATENIDLGLGLSKVQPLVLGPPVVPEVTDPAVAMKEPELAVLSAATHGNGPDGWPVLEAALIALSAPGRLDLEHRAVYFWIIYNALREPMRAAVEKWIMERHTEGKATFPPFAQQLVDRGKLEGIREGKLEGIREGKLEGIREGKLEGIREGKLEGIREGKLEGIREGKLEGTREGRLEGTREALLRLMARAGIALTEDERARIEACTDAASLDRWLDNILGAKTAADVLR